ncbi:MAG TPA: hypothetical protein VL463_10010 [Kofleriaceae bacterium]|nr:hypothetical protein [Kofleriaceae bacterium]
MRWLSLVVIAAACGGAPATDPDATGSESHPLGMNDVTILLPLPQGPQPILLGLTTDLIPQALFDRLVVAPGDVIDPFGAFQVMAVRFDICDRHTPGPCPRGVDGRMRLVFQPMLPPGAGRPGANDVALHAFYPIPATELPALVDQLRALARIGATDPHGALIVSTAVANPTYLAGLKALVTRYAHGDRLLRLTLFAQNAQASSLNWSFRGLDIDGSGAHDLVIPDVAQTQQHVILAAPDTTYDTSPLADLPAGLSLSLSGGAFMNAAPADQRGALEALAAAQNPLTHTGDTVECVACHVSTFLTTHRAQMAAIDPTTIAGRYTSTHDLSIIAGVSATNDRSLRALGWIFDQPAISQRVANDTAQVLDDIDAQFPPGPAPAP